METSIIRKQMLRFIPRLKNCYNSSCNLERSFSFQYLLREVEKYKLTSKVKFTPFIRAISVSNSMKCSDNNDSDKKNKHIENIANDPEVMSILSDFAKDFNVGSDSEQILDDIRKSLDESDSNQTLSEDKNSCSSLDSEEFRRSLKAKFKEFSDTDSSVIPSYEERFINDYHISIETESDIFPSKLSLKRGLRGVFDIEQIIDALKLEKCEDITAISVPKDLHYCDYLVIATSKSPRHSKAVCENIVKLYKLKKFRKDPFVIVEGEKVSDWKVIDMGNIVLHVFLEETRNLYDIESLWLFDSPFDRGGNLKDDPLYTAIEEQMSFFNSINETLSGNPKQKTV